MASTITTATEASCAISVATPAVAPHAHGSYLAAAVLAAMEREGISVLQTAVGDRYVLEMMKDKGWMLGGENSPTQGSPTVNNPSDATRTS